MRKQIYITILLAMMSSCGSSALLATSASHDISSLGNWGPYSKEYYGISHINDIESGSMVEFCLVPGQYRRNFKVPCTLFETDVHPWKVTADMKHICYRQEIEWKDRLYVDATYHILDDNSVLLESHCVNNTEMVQNINLQLAVRKSGGTDGQWTPALFTSENSFIVEYPEITTSYGVAWTYPLSEVREFLSGKLEQVMPLNVHDHVRKKLKGDQKGHCTANFLRPVTIEAGRDTTIWQLIVCGPREYVEDRLEAFVSNGPAENLPSVPTDDYLSQAGGYALGERLMEATLLTNVVYPIDAFGENIRHFCPGKHWNSLYTWDCGFIGWAMSELAPFRGYEIIRQYTTAPEEEAPFVHHGTPLATQILAIGDVLKNNGSDGKLLAEIYPRLKRFYCEMTGPAYRKPSGLLCTWNLFYNSGGWDDYCPQWYVRNHKELRDIVAPVVTTAYYVRCARILRMMAAHLKLAADIRKYDSDIRTMSDALQRFSWDEETGYYSYVVHNAAGEAEDIFRTGEGVNFNMGLDGVTPLVAGIPTPDQEERLLGHIFTEGELWSDCGISAVDQSAPYYRIDGYWNGTVWIPHQMLLWKTMLDLNLPERARQIAFKAMDKWEQECSDSYNCYEHFMIESGRGGGWFNFSGLSSPMVNWFCAYFKPGTISTGFNTMVFSRQLDRDKSNLKATLEFDRDAVGKDCLLLVCLSSDHNYRARMNGKDVAFTSPYPGLLEITVKATKAPAEIEVFAE